MRYTVFIVLQSTFVFDLIRFPQSSVIRSLLPGCWQHCQPNTQSHKTAVWLVHKWFSQTDWAESLRAANRHKWCWPLSPLPFSPQDWVCKVYRRPLCCSCFALCTKTQQKTVRCFNWQDQSRHTSFTVQHTEELSCLCVSPKRSPPAETATPECKAFLCVCE